MIQKHSARATALILSMVCFAGVASALAAAPTGILWQTDLEAAKRIAAQSNRLILVHFWSKSCPACVRLERDVFSQAQVQQEIQTNFVPVKLNADEWPTTVKFYGIDRLPSDLLITPSGKIVGRMTSPQKPDDYLRELA